MPPGDFHISRYVVGLKGDFRWEEMGILDPHFVAGPRLNRGVT